jgi:hypothetical protein
MHSPPTSPPILILIACSAWRDEKDSGDGEKGEQNRVGA